MVISTSPLRASKKKRIELFVERSKSGNHKIYYHNMVQLLGGESNWNAKRVHYAARLCLDLWRGRITRHQNQRH